jgi:hypothetical protein
MQLGLAFWCSKTPLSAIELGVRVRHTGAECRQWMRDAGFTHTYVEHLAGSDSMVVGIK